MKLLSFLIATLMGVCAKAQPFDIGFDMIFLGDTRIVFDKNCAEKWEGISFVHVHEDEKTAVQAAKWMIDSFQQGCFVTWQCQQQRMISFKLNDGNQYKFDPNRIYTAKGLTASLKANGHYSDSAFFKVRGVAETFKENYIINNRLVVALHNNGEAGALTVKSYAKGGVYAADIKQVFINPKKDSDDFFYTTELKIFNYLKKKGFNVALQDNIKVKDDGSLSVFCGSQQIPYLNIEAQDGHLKQQQEMLAAVVYMIKDLYIL